VQEREPAIRDFGFAGLGAAALPMRGAIIAFSMGDCPQTGQTSFRPWSGLNPYHRETTLRNGGPSCI